MRKSFRTLICLTGLGLSLTTAGTGSSTLLRGRVLDPFSGDGIGDVALRMGPVEGTTDAAGRFRLQRSAGGRRPFPTTAAGDGYAPYSTWTPRGERRRRLLYLFPTEPVVVPDQAAAIVPGEVLEQFDIIYRTRLITPVSPAGEVVHRWIEQPEVYIVSHVMEYDPDSDRHWRASGTRLSTAEIQFTRGLLRTYLPLLTADQLSGRRVQVRRVAPGDRVELEFETVAPRGDLVLFAHRSASTTGAMYISEGAEIVSGAVIVEDRLLRGASATPSTRTVIHELGHALGMSHPNGGSQPVVPLCSIMGNYGCLGARHVSALDVALARLAYSRLPGNDRTDHDPQPTAARAPAISRPAVFDGMRRSTER